MTIEVLGTAQFKIIFLDEMVYPNYPQDGWS